MTTSGHTQVVQRQFGEQASAYLNSAVHAQGAEFALLQDAVRGRGDARVLDLGCGAGHVSFNVAPSVAEVIAYDLSQQMLDVVAAAAIDKGLSNVRTLCGAAERLPFADGEFDFVFSRYSAHHWSDLALALREVRRVLKPGGVAAFIDVMSPGSPLLDTYLQTVEVLRDTSHVRDYSAAEWLHQVSDAGLFTRSHTRQRLHLEFGSWWSACARHSHCGWPYASCSRRWAMKCVNISRLMRRVHSVPMCWCCGPSVNLFAA